MRSSFIHPATCFKKPFSIIPFIALFHSFLWILCPHVQASSLTEVVNKADQLEIASHPTWRKLLHFERGENMSAMLTDTFFLAQTGRHDPKAELTATINAYFAPWEQDGNDHARCRFPARYFWLSKHLPLPAYTVQEPRCLNFKRWGLLDTVQSISLLLVSGYLGNPASTFGHALLKFNTDAPHDSSGLFDLTLNYGALVPENENSLRYVIHGLFGGYEAGFSDRYFHTHDHVYSRREFRDMWNYKLALSEHQRTLLILHVWEITGKKFRYYFLDKNCAYRLAELLNLVIEEDLLNNASAWYLPVELFHRLRDINAVRRNSLREALIQAVRFVPSSQRKLYHRINLLTQDELAALNAIILEGIDSLSTHTSKFTMDRQMLLLEGLLAYQQYRLFAEEPTPSPSRRALKDRFLLARLQLPARLASLPAMPALSSPAEGSRPMEIGIGMAIDTNENSFLRLNWSPYKQEVVGRNSLDGDEFVVADLAIGLLEDEHDIFVDKFDVIRLLKLNTFSGKIQEDNPWSWQLRVGIDRIAENRERFDAVLMFGAGQAQKWNRHLTGYALVDVAGHSIAPFVQLRPHAGWILRWRSLRTWLYCGAESNNDYALFSAVWGGKLQYDLTDRYAVRLEFSNEFASLTSFGINWYW